MSDSAGELLISHSALENIAWTAIREAEHPSEFNLPRLFSVIAFHGLTPNAWQFQTVREPHVDRP